MPTKEGLEFRPIDGVVAVVVTYNRLSLLQLCIEALRRNAPKDIIVVNNGSTDGTTEWLAGQTDLHIVNQNNVGGSGGFHTGICLAMELGATWIWCMDDDVRPHDSCLSQFMLHTWQPQLGIMAPRRLLDGRIFTNDFCRYNLTNPFRSMYQSRLRKRDVSKPTEIVGTAFEGMFIRRTVVERVGLPNRELFIFCDDTDFCLRAHQAGFRMLYIPDALMEKEAFFCSDSWAQKQKKKKWKRAYHTRNSTYLNHHYGKNWTVRYLRSLIGLTGQLLIVCLTAPFGYGYHWRDIPTFVKAYRDGIQEKLGKY